MPEGEFSCDRPFDIDDLVVTSMARCKTNNRVIRSCDALLQRQDILPVLRRLYSGK